MRTGTKHDIPTASAVATIRPTELHEGLSAKCRRPIAPLSRANDHIYLIDESPCFHFKQTDVRPKPGVRPSLRFDARALLLDEFAHGLVGAEGTLSIELGAP